MTPRARKANWPNWSERNGESTDANDKTEFSLLVKFSLRLKQLFYKVTVKKNKKWI